MYTAKASFFDGQVQAPWAADEYSTEELAKLERVFDILGDLAGWTILEPGCGTGRLTDILSGRVGPRGRVIALDISPGMIGEARKRLAERANVDLLVAAVEDLDLSQGSVDLVFCHQVFPHIEDKARALGMFHRALNLGGRLILFHLIGFQEINDVHRKAGSVVEGDLMPEAQVMRSLMTGRGFRIEILQDHDFDCYFLSAVKIC
ncbi:MAG: methyltransferase domain-containing protein [Deltaproteobacteria bacterium]|nr:methyltransferase domain-containing protein [Deltaproteobacteria bacterium]